MTFELWLAFVAASGLLLLIPGPTVLLVLSYALARGRGTALACVAGVALGDLIAMTLSLVGLGALILTSALLFGLLKWIGAIYLVYLGITLLRAAPAALQPDPAQTQPRRIFWHAATVTALNPKSIAFFIAFVPQFLTPDAPLAPQCALLIATFVTLAALNTLAYALAADRFRRSLSRPVVLVWLTRAGGATLIALGALTATLRRAT